MKTTLYILIISFFFTACQKEKVIYVADHYGDCESQYLLVREKENEDWIIVKNKIEGFNYIEGFSYQLKIIITKDDSNLIYQLVEVMSKVKTEITNHENDTDNSDKKWFVNSIKGYSNKTDKIPYFSIEEGRISGNNGCNDFGGKITFDKSGFFKITDLFVTKMYCEKYASLESVINSSISQAVSYKITDGILFLLDKSNYVLLTAKKDASSIKANAIQDKPYKIEYRVFSRELAFKTNIDEEKNNLVYSRTQPDKTPKKSKILTKSDLKYFKDQFLKIGLENLRNIKPPSTKHQYDGAPLVNLTITFNGETYYVPPFDHGNPPKELQAFVERIIKLQTE
jgi:heat shock protein HslJ